MNEYQKALTMIIELEDKNAELLEVLDGFLELHATYMADAGFNPPVCKCELCIAGRKAKGD